MHRNEKKNLLPFDNKNLAIAKRSRVSCAHNTSRAFRGLITPWPWNLVSFARWSELLVQNREIFVPHLYLAPPKSDDPVGISWRCLMLIKLGWLCYRMVKNNCDDMLSRFHLTPPTGALRTDGRTDLLYQCRASVCWRATKTMNESKSTRPGYVCLHWVELS